MRRRRRTSSPPRAIAARDAPLRIEGVGSESIQGDIAFVDAVRAMGATIDAEAHALTVRRGRFPLAPITLDCNHIPDAAMTLAALALFASGPSRLENIASWRVKETDRLAAMAAELRKVGADVVEGADSLEITPPRALARRPRSRPTTTTAWRWRCRWRPSTAPPARRRRCRCGSATRAASPRPGPTTSRRCSAVASAVPSAIPVLDHRRPDRLRQGHAGERGRRRARLRAARLRRRLPRRRHRRAAGRRRGRRRGRPRGAGARAWTCASTPAGPSSPAPTSAIRSASRPSARSPRASPPGRACAAPCSACRLAFRRLPGLVADGRDMGTVVFPDAEPQGLPHRERRRTCRAPATSN